MRGSCNVVENADNGERVRGMVSKIGASESHEKPFAFGKNWASYAKTITQPQIDEAISGLRRLVGDGLEGKRFLDIGCGSGIHALAALRLGASEVVAVDVDKDSVATTRSVLQTHAAGGSWKALERSVFDMDCSSMGRFDVVYSWGVLHHTGDMYRALRIAATLVGPGGEFAFALYRRTRLCWFWKIEKKWYAGASPRGQAMARSVFAGLFRVVFPIVNKRSFDDYVAGYRSARGMEFYHDVHDWMGGWPYESISPDEVERLMAQLGMCKLRIFARTQRRSMGIFGSGCDEYVYAPAGR